MKIYKCVYCGKKMKKIGEVYNHYYESGELDINTKIIEIK